MQRSLSWGIVTRLFIPFALAYFGSVLLRNVNAVAAPHLVNDFGLNAADLGLLTGLYFISFTLAQLPLGGLLDRFDSARVNAVVLLSAAAGTLMFALASNVLMLGVGRTLIGLGVAICLMSSLRAAALWLPAQYLPIANGVMFAVGTLGAIAATAPTQWAIAGYGWRAVFAACAVYLLLAIVALWVVPPSCKAELATGVNSKHQPISMREALRHVWRNALARHTIPASAFATGILWAVQSLWAGPWLDQVAGLQGSALANVLICMPIGMLVGNLFHGWVTGKLREAGKDGFAYNRWMLVLFALTCLPFVLKITTALPLLFFAFGFFGAAGNSYFALLGPYYQKTIVGRANGVLNMAMFGSIFIVQWAMGVIVNLYRGADGKYDVHGFAVATMVMLAIYVATLIWLWPAKEPESGKRT